VKKENISFLYIDNYIPTFDLMPSYTFNYQLHYFTSKFSEFEDFAHLVYFISQHKIDKETYKIRL